MKIQRSAVVLLLGMLLVTTIACGGGQGSSPTPTPAWVIYSNSSCGISMQYPQNWAKIEGQNGFMYSIVFTSPAHGESTFAERLALSKIQETEPVELSDWVDTWVLGLKSDIPGFNLSESSSTTLAGMLAQKLVFTHELNQFSFKSIEIISVKNNTVYWIDFAADLTTYDSDVETAQQMIDSLVIY